MVPGSVNMLSYFDRQKIFCPYCLLFQVQLTYGHKKRILKYHEQSVVQKSNLRSYSAFCVKLQHTRFIGQFWMHKIPVMD